MASQQLRAGTRPIVAKKAIVAPDFRSRTVLVADTWDYVAMWLRRGRNRDALFYWDQARNFSEATRSLPKTSSPLTAYYSFLNAAKTLLTVKKQTFAEVHGVSGSTQGRRTSLANEIVTFQGGGVLAALCRYLGETARGEQYSVRDLLYNLPYVHRAFSLTYAASRELFLPVAEPRFVRKSGSSEAWFCANINDPKYRDARTLRILAAGYERDTGETQGFVLRRRRRFEWKAGRGQFQGNLDRLTTYHRRVRRDLFYIHSPMRLWYLKRRHGLHGMIERSSMTISFAVMHRLSELARYEPMRLARHFEARHNWLLAEFIASAPNQFFDEISSEITGEDFFAPGRRSA